LEYSGADCTYELDNFDNARNGAEIVDVEADAAPEAAIAADGRVRPTGRAPAFCGKNFLNDTECVS